MNSFKNNFFIYLLITISPFASVSCQSNNETEFVQFVVQPEAEIGKNIDFSINFKEKPDTIYFSSKEINGLELTDNLDKVLDKITESNITDDKGKVIKSFYKFYTYAKPTKIGRIDFPILTMRFKGKEYQTKPFYINVVKKTTINENAVQLVWSTEQTVYKKKDTITISLYEYSKFSQTTRIHSFSKNISLKGKQNQINLNTAETIDNISGINGFEKAIEDKFEIVGVDWNMFRSRQSMKKIENEVYIKTLILELHLLAKTKENFEVGPSEFDFSLYKNNTDYFAKYVPNNKGTYNVTKNGSTTLKIKSNKLTLEIQ